MQRRNSILAVLASILLVWGCSDSGSSSPSSVSGQGPKSLANALVCVDENDNFTCDSEEPATRTGADGSYSLAVEPARTAGHRLLLVVDGETADAATGSFLPDRFVLASLAGKPQIISVYTTLLAADSGLDEKAVKDAFEIGGNGSLSDVYAADGEVGLLAGRLQDAYAGMYIAAAAVPGSTPESRVAKAAGTLLDNAGHLLVYFERLDLPARPPLVNAGDPQPTVVRDEIFQNILIDAGTMFPGVGMNEITRDVVSGSKCLAGSLELDTPMAQKGQTYLFRLVESEKDLLDLLNVGGRLDLGNQVVQGSIEGRFVDDYRSHSEAIFALIRAENIMKGYPLKKAELDSKYLTDDPGHASYTSNYEAFRKACGDRYLQQVTTGGAYYGLLRITAKDSTTKKDLQVKLDGKYGKGAVEVKVAGDLQSSLQAIVSETNIAITIGSRGVSPQVHDGGNYLINSLDTFFTNANEFMAYMATQQDACSANPLECAYTATFADYITATGGLERNATQNANLTFAQEIMGKYEDYNTLKKMINDIIAHSTDYNLAAKAMTIADLFESKADLEDGQDLMRDALNNCTTDFEGCTTREDAKDAHGLSTFSHVKRNLPRLSASLPRECAELDTTNGTNVTLYLAGDQNKPFKVTCTKLDTSEPEAFLELYNTSGSTAGLSYNMAQNVNPDGSLVSSIYKKLRVNINYNNVEIINDQDAEIETASTASDDSPTTDANFKQARLGTAVDCYQTAGQAKSNIDLTGTKFKFDDSLVFATGVHPSTKYAWIPTAMTWDAADVYAKGLGGHLIVIDSSSEWSTVSDLLLRKYHNSWVGLKRTDSAQPEQYRQLQWVATAFGGPRNLTSLEKNDYFYSGEPNNYQGNENCGRYASHFYYGALNFKLDDFNCAEAYPFLVEFDLQVPSGVANFNQDRTVVEVSVNGEAQGNCLEIRPANNVIRLQYAP